MVDLKVSKVTYLICTIFSCIIKYQRFRDQYKIVDWQEYFIKSPKKSIYSCINTKNLVSLKKRVINEKSNFV